MSKTLTAKSPWLAPTVLGSSSKSPSPSMMVGHRAATCPGPAQDTRSKLAFGSPAAVPQCQQIPKTNTTEIYQRQTQPRQDRDGPSAELVRTPGSRSWTRTVNLCISTLRKSPHLPPPQFPCPEESNCGETNCSCNTWSKCFTPGNSLRLLPGPAPPLAPPSAGANREGDPRCGRHSRFHPRPPPHQGER